MLSKLITYRLLLRVAGILLLLWALYIALQIATLQTYVGDSYVGLQIQYSFRLTILFILQTGVPLLAAVAVLLLGFSFRHPTIAYWSVQLAIWLAGISLWYRFNYIFNPLPQNPLWLIVTVLCSMLMFVLYKPVMGLIRKLVPPKSKKPNINPKDEPYSSSQYEQPQVMYPKQD
jgi:hypothetical protein